VGDAVELLANGPVDQRLAVAVDVAPQGRDAVDVAPPLGVDQVGPIGALDRHRLFPTPVELLGEWMPEVVAIPVGNGLLGRGRCPIAIPHRGRP